MKPIVKIMIRRALMTLGAIGVWVKALAGDKADGQTRSTPETEEKDSGGSKAKTKP